MTELEWEWAVWYVRRMVRWQLPGDRRYVYRGIACVDDFPHGPKAWHRQLIAAAHAGDARAREELIESVAAFLGLVNEDPPPEVRHSKLQRRRGPRVPAGRDDAVILGVRLLLRLPTWCGRFRHVQLKATRTNAPPQRPSTSWPWRSRSACAVVAEAFELRYRTVERIWLAWNRPRLP